MKNDKNILQIVRDKGDNWFIAIVQNFYFLPISGYWSSTDANDGAEFWVEWKIGRKDNDISFNIAAVPFKRMAGSKNPGKVTSGLSIINRLLIGVKNISPVLWLFILSLHVLEILDFSFGHILSFFIFTILFHNSENINFNLLHITVFEWNFLKMGFLSICKCSAIKTFSGSVGSSIIATVADVFIFEGIFIVPICFDLVLGLFSTPFSWTIKGRFAKWQICSCSVSAYAVIAKLRN